jgi:serine/threonine-protein kinase RsbW
MLPYRMPHGKEMLAGLAEGEDPGPVIAAALAAASDFAEGAGLAEETRARLLVIVEEIVSNCVRHGRGDQTLVIALKIRTRDDGLVEMLLEDDGLAFDPTGGVAFSGPDPDTGGGVGLELVKAWANELEYENRGGRNHVRVVLDRGARPLA